MIEKGLAAIAIAVTIGLITAFLVRPVLRRLPEPIPGSGKPIYRDLGTTRFVLVCGSLAGIAAAVSWLTVPRYVQPLWSVLAILGVLLAAIDARTSWLPLLLTRIAWLAMAVASVLAASLGGGVWLAARSAAGAAIAGGLYLLVWLLSRGGFGFGDVRFAPLLGAACGRRLMDVAVVDPVTRDRGWRAGWCAATRTAPTGRIPIRTVDVGWRLRCVPDHHAQLTVLHSRIARRRAEKERADARFVRERRRSRRPRSAIRSERSEQLNTGSRAAVLDERGSRHAVPYASKDEIGGVPKRDPRRSGAEAMCRRRERRAQRVRTRPRHPTPLQCDTPCQGR